MVLKRVNDVVKDALADERAHGIVEDEVDVLILIGSDGRQRRVVTLLTALKNLLHLAPLVSQDDIFEVADEHRIRHDGNLVNAQITLKDIDSVLHYHLTSHLEELLWCGHAETFSYATGKYNGYVSFHCIGFWDVKYIVRDVKLHNYFVINILRDRQVRNLSSQVWGWLSAFASGRRRQRRVLRLRRSADGRSATSRSCRRS